MNNMTRRDIIIKWIAYLIALGLAAVVNFYVLGPLPIPLPLMLPVLAVAGGTLEGAPFGALYGMACGAVLSGLGHLGAGWGTWGRSAWRPWPCSAGRRGCAPSTCCGGTPGAT